MQGVIPSPGARNAWGMTVVEAAVAVGLFALILLVVLVIIKDNDYGQDKGEGALFGAKLIYARNRIDELTTLILLFQDAHGCLPGDCKNSGVPGVEGGNGNGRVDAGTSEVQGVFDQLHASGSIPNTTPLFLKKRIYFMWFDKTMMSPTQGAHYFVVPETPVWLAKFYDEREDDGDPSHGNVGYANRQGQVVDLYVKFGG